MPTDFDMTGVLELRTHAELVNRVDYDIISYVLSSDTTAVSRVRSAIVDALNGENK